MPPLFGSWTRASTGPTGSSVSLSTPLKKMSFGPCPRIVATIGPPDRGHEDQEDDEDAARDRNAVAAEADPDLLPVASRADRLGALAELRPGLDGDGSRETCLC